MIRADDRPSRRTLLGAASAAVLTAGCSADSNGQPAAPAATASAPGQVTPTGTHQAGIATPHTPQPNLLAIIADITPSLAPSAVQSAAPSAAPSAVPSGAPSGPLSAVGRLLAELGETIVALSAGTEPRLVGLVPGDLTVTVGVGPRLVRMAGRTLPGATDLPAFAHEQIAPAARGGDVLLQICASDPLVLSVAAAALLDRAGDRLRERWRQSARRGPAVQVAEGLTAPRNQLGFVDGIVGPHTEAEQSLNLWLDEPAPVAGGTIAVLRRMELDLRRFAGLSAAHQEAVIGRHRDTGIPLSGGVVADGPDLGAKTPDGRYLVPADAHARRAHAAVVGVRLMLRRSYSIDEPAPGLLFVSFQNDLRTFTATLTHMENGDALLPFTKTTASATFLILPGFDPRRPLGSTLF
ncbi:dye decolorizing peroxidase [Kribbella aluminosa]|uniref:Dye decolorizing peroxidase n=1 Tax=Kribbella aluminosa TaxID=416017 RepID=A0ABS4UUJ2_9ACTN|nr:Dyp-type peroxidase [Kribbella aluminosa]MBP2355318.1 dye decolorizing peroxidase [Kribbella aluminosa]